MLESTIVPDPSSSDEEEEENLEEEGLPTTAPDIHHYISHEMKNKINLSAWLQKNKNDIVCEVRPQKKHLISTYM